jgi:site-specific recombinase XerD
MVINWQTSTCPVQLLSTYLNHHGCSPGPVFTTVEGVAVPRKVFTANLVACLKYCDLSLSHYKSHLFRIGAASFAAENGLSDAQIHLLGRWKINAFQKYIRVSSLSMTASLSE